MKSGNLAEIDFAFPQPLSEVRSRLKCRWRVRQPDAQPMSAAGKKAARVFPRPSIFEVANAVSICQGASDGLLQMLPKRRLKRRPLPACRLRTAAAGDPDKAFSTRCVFMFRRLASA